MISKLNLCCCSSELFPFFLPSAFIFMNTVLDLLSFSFSKSFLLYFCNSSIVIQVFSPSLFFPLYLSFSIFSLIRFPRCSFLLLLYTFFFLPTLPALQSSSSSLQSSVSPPIQLSPSSNHRLSFDSLYFSVLFPFHSSFW